MAPAIGIGSTCGVKEEYICRLAGLSLLNFILLLALLKFYIYLDMIRIEKA